MVYQYSYINKNHIFINKSINRISDDIEKEYYTTRNGINFIATKVDLDVNSAKNLAFMSGSSQKDTVIVLGSLYEGKPSISCYVSENLVKTKGLNRKEISLF